VTQLSRKGCFSTVLIKSCICLYIKRVDILNRRWFYYDNYILIIIKYYILIAEMSENWKKYTSSQGPGSVSSSTTRKLPKITKNPLGSMLNTLKERNTRKTNANKKYDDNLLKIANREDAYDNKGTRKSELSSEYLNYIERVYYTLAYLRKNDDYYDLVLSDYAEVLISKFSMENIKVSRNNTKKKKGLIYRLGKTLGQKFGVFSPKIMTRRNRLNFLKFDNFVVSHFKKKYPKFKKGAIHVPWNMYTAQIKSHMVSVRNYRMNIYNEILGFILVLIEKAKNKFLTDNFFSWIIQRTKEKIPFLEDYKKGAGIFSLSSISREYVFNILGTDLDVRLQDKFKIEQEIREHLKLSTLSYKYMGSVIEKIGIQGFAAIIGTYLSNDTISILSSAGQEVAKYMVLALNATHPLAFVSTLVSHGALSTSGFGGPTLAMIAYKIGRGYLKAKSFKEEFVRLHKILFDPANQLSFDDAKKIASKEHFFVYYNLSEGEKKALEDFKNILYSTVAPTQKQVSKYLNDFYISREKRFDDKKNKILTEKIEAAAATLPEGRGTRV